MLYFKDFLLNEAKHYLGERAGDILTALQNLQQDGTNMGTRALTRACEGIVNQIRRILHGRWDEEDVKYLKNLQKVGVALMKAIEENEDMQQVIASCVSELEGMLDGLQVPINSLGSEFNNVKDDEMAPSGNQKQPPRQEEEPLKAGTELGI